MSCPAHDWRCIAVWNGYPSAGGEVRGEVCERCGVLRASGGETWEEAEFRERGSVGRLHREPTYDWENGRFNIGGRFVEATPERDVCLPIVGVGSDTFRTPPCPDCGGRIVWAEADTFQGRPLTWFPTQRCTVCGSTFADSRYCGARACLECGAPGYLTADLGVSMSESESSTPPTSRRRIVWPAVVAASGLCLLVGMVAGFVGAVPGEDGDVVLLAGFFVSLGTMVGGCLWLASSR